MSRNAAIVLVVVILLVLGGWYMSSQPAVSPSSSEYGSQTSGYPSAQGSSNASLDQDTASIDAELNAMTADTAKADSGLNNQNQ